MPRFRKNNSEAELEVRRLLKLRLRSQKVGLLQQRTRADELRQENMILQDRIEAYEGVMYDKVTRALVLNERLGQSSIAINTHHQTNVLEKQEQLSQVEQTLDDKLSNLKKDVEEASNDLEKWQNFVSSLDGYQDREYPVKLMQIKSLMHQLDQLKVSNEYEEKEVKRVLESQNAELKRQRLDATEKIAGKLTDKAFALMHPTLLDTANQNVTFKTEIETHERKIQQLTSENETLRTTIDLLLREPEANVIQQTFPHLFERSGGTRKCLPDDLVELDIPKIRDLAV